MFSATFVSCVSCLFGHLRALWMWYFVVPVLWNIIVLCAFVQTLWWAYASLVSLFMLCDCLLDGSDLH
jgi:hypothetical protein